MALDPILERRLHEVGLRRHLQGRLDAASAALAAACLTLAALRVGLWLFGPAVAAAHPLPWLWLVVPLGALGAGGWVWWRRRGAASSPLETARFLDRELRLDDRLATAVELFGPGSHAAAPAYSEMPRGAVGALLHYDAAAHAQRVDPEAAVPPRWPAGLGRLSAGLLAAVIVLLPIFPASPMRPASPSAAAAEQALMHARGEEIQQLAEQLQAQAKEEPDSSAADMAAQLQSLAQQMIGSQLTPEQAQRLLSQLQTRLSTLDRERANAALNQLEAAQRAAISPDQMRALAAKLTEAASQPTPPSSAQKSELARQLQALQDQLGGDSSLSRALQRISDELENGDVGQAARDLSALNRQLSAQQQTAQNAPGGRPTESAGAGGTSGASQAAAGGGAPPAGTPGEEGESPYEGGGTHTPGNMQAGGPAGEGGSNQGGGYGSGTGDGAAGDAAGRTPSNAVQYTPAPITGDLRAGAPNIAALPGLPNQAAPSAPAANYAPAAAGGGGEQAVTQEQVPIVYRQWVKRYFDS